MPMLMAPNPARHAHFRTASGAAGFDQNAQHHGIFRRGAQTVADQFVKKRLAKLDAVLVGLLAGQRQSRGQHEGRQNQGK